MVMGFFQFFQLRDLFKDRSSPKKQDMEITNLDAPGSQPDTEVENESIAESDFPTNCEVFKKREEKVETRVPIFTQHDSGWKVEGTIDRQGGTVIMSNRKEEALVRLEALSDRSRRIVHLCECRKQSRYGMCEIQEDREGEDSSILVWREKDGAGRPLWAISVRKREQLVTVQEVSSMRTLAVIDRRPIRKLFPRGPSTTRVEITGGADIKLMTMIGACIEEICAEVFGRNLPLILQLQERMKSDEKLYNRIRGAPIVFSY